MSYNRWINYERHLIIDIRRHFSEFKQLGLVMERDNHTKYRGLILVNLLVFKNSTNKVFRTRLNPTLYMSLTYFIFTVNFGCWAQTRLDLI